MFSLATGYREMFYVAAVFSASAYISFWLNLELIRFVRAISSLSVRLRRAARKFDSGENAVATS